MLTSTMRCGVGLDGTDVASWIGSYPGALRSQADASSPLTMVASGQPYGAECRTSMAQRRDPALLMGATR